MFAAQIQKVLKEAQPVTSSRGEEAQRYDEVQIGAALQSMGIQIGDKVVVGGVKVRDHYQGWMQDFEVLNGEVGVNPGPNYFRKTHTNKYALQGCARFAKILLSARFCDVCAR